jgi:hypothetical protein
MQGGKEDYLFYEDTPFFIQKPAEKLSMQNTSLVLRKAAIRGKKSLFIRNDTIGDLR